MIYKEKVIIVYLKDICIMSDQTHSILLTGGWRRESVSVLIRNPFLILPMTWHILPVPRTERDLGGWAEIGAILIPDVTDTYPGVDKVQVKPVWVKGPISAPGTVYYEIISNDGKLSGNLHFSMRDSSEAVTLRATLSFSDRGEGFFGRHKWDKYLDHILERHLKKSLEDILIVL